LVATGDWSRAEIELNTALKESRGSQPALAGNSDQHGVEIATEKGLYRYARRIETPGWKL
jgi:hypothetical protein